MKQRLAAAVVVLAIVGAAVWGLSDRGIHPRRVSGTIEADEIRLASRYGGRVEAIHAEEGDVVPPGARLISLAADELRARRDAIAAVLEELVNGPRAEEVAAAKADQEALEAQLQFARGESQRARQLFEEKAISSTERDRAISQAEALSKQAAAATQRYQLLLAGSRKERIAQARAQVAEIDAQLREMQIVAPAAEFIGLEGERPREPQSGDDDVSRSAEGDAAPNPGRTERRSRSAPGSNRYILETLPIKVGDVLAPNQVAAILIRTDRLWVRVFVPESWLGCIALDQVVEVRVDSHHDRQFEGVVEQINRKAEFTPRNVQTAAERIKQVYGVKIRLPSDTDILKPGMAAEVTFPDVPPVPKD